MQTAISSKRADCGLLHIYPSGIRAHLTDYIAMCHTGFTLSTTGTCRLHLPYRVTDRPRRLRPAATASIAASHAPLRGPSVRRGQVARECRHDFSHELTMFVHLERMAARQRELGRERTAETYSAALRSFRCFRDGRDVPLSRVDSDLLMDYQAWLSGRGVCLNTVSFYMRILRAAYNAAVADEAVTDVRPFRRVYTGIAKTRKRAIALEDLRRIKEADLTGQPTLDHARDMFLLSFYLRGISFIDMAYLRKADLIDGHIIYNRRKTGQRLTIAWTPEMQRILDKYPSNPTDYLLPIIRREDANPRAAYRRASYTVNRHLKAIAAMLGLHTPLTMYVARHSWATAAKAQDIPLSLISEGLGHHSEATTRIYLTTLDHTPLHQANARILASL